MEPSLPFPCLRPSNTVRTLPDPQQTSLTFPRSPQGCPSSLHCMEGPGGPQKHRGHLGKSPLRDLLSAASSPGTCTPGGGGRVRPVRGRDTWALVPAFLRRPVWSPCSASRFLPWGLGRHKLREPSCNISSLLSHPSGRIEESRLAFGSSWAGRSVVQPPNGCEGHQGTCVWGSEETVSWV